MSSTAETVRKRTPPAWALFTAAGGLALFFYYFVPAVKGNGLLFNAIGLASVIAVVAGVRLHKPRTSAAWYLFAGGLLLFALGDIFYYAYPNVFDTEIPFPSIGDGLYLGVYPLLIAGLLMLIHKRNPRGDRPSLIDALIVTTAVALLSWIYVMAPYAHDSSVGWFGKAVLLAYPTMDVALLAVAVRLAIDTGARQRAFYLMALSIVALFVTDVAYSVYQLGAVYQEGGILELGWASYYIFWGAAALHPSMRNLEEPSPNRTAKLTRARLALLTGASLIAPAVQAFQALRGQPVDLPVMIGSSALLFVLVVMRMAGLLHEYQRSVAREKALREAARALVAATSREEVYSAALDSMMSLVGGDHEARLCLLCDEGGMQVVAARGSGGREDAGWPLMPEHFRPLAGKSMDARGAIEMQVSNAHLRQALRLSRDCVEALAFPLLIRDEPAGLMFVAGPRAFSSELTDALQTLAASVELALESTTLTEDLHRRQSESRFQSLVQNSTDLITVIEADTTIKYVSPSVEKILGYEMAALIGTKFQELLHPRDLDHALSLLTQGFGGAELGASDLVETRVRHRDGTWFFFEILRTNLLHDDNVAGIVLNGRDVSERKAFEEQLTHQAFHDPVTDLANRALFSDRVQHALARRVREMGGVAVMFVDLDDFKVINDSLGHVAGDRVLSEVGARLQACVRPVDTVARFGGDEFALLLEDVERPQEVAEVAERILRSLEEGFRLESKEVFITVSIGVVIVQGEDAITASAEETIRNADVAMYMAKKGGKGQYRVFEPEMHADVVDRLEMKGDLQRAIEGGQLELHYQPVVTLDTGAVSGLEALVRWNHPTRGLIPPLQFIPLAEETGLILPLGKWVLNEACRKAKALQAEHDLDPSFKMAVNLSAKQLVQMGLVGSVVAALRDSGLDAKSLTLEITESVLMSDTEATIVKLHELKALGVRLAVDDFGTGYSSLSYLSRFPVDILKIDRSFVSRVTDGAGESALASAIVKLGEALHLETVAEGIEDPEQMDQLVRLGCGLGQGYYFAKPLNADALTSFLNEVSSDARAAVG